LVLMPDEAEVDSELMPLPEVLATA